MMQSGPVRPLGAAFDRIADALSGLGSGTTADAVLAVAAAGVIAAALVQLAKELTPIRRSYQRRWVKRWIGRRASGELAAQAEQDLVDLATGDCVHAFFELPSEEMALHINQAGQITLDAPEKYEVLLGVLAHGMTSADFDDLVARLTGGSQQYFDVRNRMARRIQRNVEGLRLGLGRDWRFWMQLASVLLTVACVTGTVAYGSKWAWNAILLSIPVGLVGGYFAPITHDLAQALAKLRKWSP